MLYTDGANVQWLHVDVGVGPTITSPAQHRQQSFSPLVGGLVAAAGLWLVLAMNLRWWCSNLEPPWQWPRTGELPGCLAWSRYRRSPRQHQHQQPGSFSTSPAHTNTSTSLDIATYHHTETKILHTAKLY